MKNNSQRKTFNSTTMNAKYIFTLIALSIGFNVKASTNFFEQTPDYDSALSLFSSPLFNVLLGTVVLLLIFIMTLSGVLKDVVTNKVRDEKNNSGNVAGVITVLILFSGSSLFAQGSANTELIAPYIDIPTGVFYTLLTAIGFEIIILISLLSLIRSFTKKYEEVVKEEPSLLEVLNASVAVEDEDTIMLDHDYDGIRELDNDLPPWWKYGFYLTIITGTIYLFNYHILQTSPLQAEEWEISMEKARLAKEEYQKMNANSVNENNVTLLTDAAEIEKGGKTYQEMCFACHGKYGEGGVGPNLTDEYWLHGGSIKDIFFSIKYGWPNKGMKSWEADMSPSQIHQVSSYIKTLQGTNPDNAKEKQGELYVEQVVVESDSLATDSASTAALPKAE